MEDNLRLTIQKIRLLAEQNAEFKNEMQKLFGNTGSASAVNNEGQVSTDVAAIRMALEIRGNASISYDFIKEQRLRDQLYIDNLRMENAALNLKEKEIDRFYTFCVNAFYQVENIVNYYFYSCYPQIDDLLDILETSTKDDGEKGKYQFKRSQTAFKEKTVGDIPIFYKINALCNMLFPNDVELKITLDNLQKVRNEGEHRCQVIYSEKDDTNSLYQFLQKATFNTIRIYLKKVVATIKKELLHPVGKQKCIESIVNNLTGMCFVTLNGENVQLPAKLIKKISGLKKDDKIEITLDKNVIVDVNPYSSSETDNKED